MNGTPHTPFVIEPLGPAGSGKSTLVSHLLRRDKHIVAASRPNKLELAWSVLKIVARFYPLYLRQYRHDRWFSLDEIRGMAYLQTWYPLGRGRIEGHPDAVMFDHGPLFRLVQLHEFGPTLTRSAAFMQWWNQKLEQWAQTLDMLVLLDAPDSILLQRIFARPKWRRIMEQDDEEQHQFLAAYRAFFEQLAGRVAQDGIVACLRFATDQYTSEQIAEEVYRAIQNKRAEGAAHPSAAAPRRAGS